MLFIFCKYPKKVDYHNFQKLLRVQLTVRLEKNDKSRKIAFKKRYFSFNFKNLQLEFKLKNRII